MHSWLTAFHSITSFVPSALIVGRKGRALGEIRKEKKRTVFTVI